MCYTALCQLAERFKNHSGSRLIAKSYMHTVGAGTVDKFKGHKIDGMAEDFTWHKNHNTTVYATLLHHGNKHKVNALWKRSHTIAVPNEVYKAIDHVQGQTSGIQSNLRNIITDPIMAGGDILLGRSLSQEFKEKIHMFSSTAYLTYAVTECDGTMTASPHKNNDFGKAVVRLNAQIKIDMIAAHCKRLKAGDSKYEVLTTELSDGTTTRGPDAMTKIIGSDPYIFSLSGEELGELAAQYEIYAWGTTNVESIGERKIMIMPNPSDELTRSDTGYKRVVHVVHEDQLESITSGKRIRTTELKWHCVKSFGRLHVFKLSRNQIWMETNISSNRIIVVPTPRLITDINEFIKTKKLIVMQNEPYNLDLLENVMRRPLRPGTTYDDLLVQVRTLINTAQFSTHAVSSRYKANAGDGKKVARLTTC
jgi:hypothetical protein